jgi:hypothetical protein
MVVLSVVFNVDVDVSSSKTVAEIKIFEAINFSLFFFSIDRLSILLVVIFAWLSNETKPEARAAAINIASNIERKAQSLEH